MALWRNIARMFGFGISRRSEGIQHEGPSSGRLTTRAVTPDTAMQLSAVFACVRLLAETIAGLPLNFYRLDGDRNRTQDHDYELFRLVSYKPNRYQTHVEFFETVVFQLALHGNSYCRVDRAGKKIVSLLPLMSSQIQVALDSSGKVSYVYHSDGKVKEYTQDQIWHVKLFGNGIIGGSPMDFARNSLGIALAAEDRVNTMANNGFKPSGILMIDKVLSKEQRAQIRDSFADLAQGGDDALRVLEAGMTYQQVSMNPKDVQLLETRRFQTEDIARFFGVPSVLINDTSASTVWGSGIQQIMLGFYKLGLRPYMERIESSITNWLIPVEDRRNIIPEFDFDMLLRGDEKIRYETYSLAVKGGILTPNETRSQEGLKPLAGGDSLFPPSKPGGAKDEE